jgi:AsmA protein
LRVRAARWILGIAGAAVLLALALVLTATLLINPDRYKGQIERAVTRDTGQPLALQGHLALTWFPWLGVRTGPGQLGNASGSAAGPGLIAWQSAAVRVRLLPLLLHRQLQVGRVRIVGADIRLRRGPDGRGSWEDVLARLQPANPTPGGASGATAPPELGGLDLRDSTLHFTDEGTGERVRLQNWQLSVGPWHAGGPLSVRTSFRLHAQGAALRLPSPGVDVALDLPVLQVRTDPLAIAAPRWSLQLADARLAGAITGGADSAGALHASGSLSATVPSLRQLAGTLGIALPVLADPATLAQLSLSGRWTYRAGAFEVSPLIAKLDATTITGWISRAPVRTGTAPNSPSGSDWNFALRADSVDFGRYLTHSRQQKPLALPVAALRALHAHGTLAVARARIDGTILEDVRLQVQ